jgi:hypothetical protein
VALLSFTELAQKFGCSQQAVRRLAVQLCIHPCLANRRARHAVTLAKEQATQIAEFRCAPYRPSPFPHNLMTKTGFCRSGNLD